jgi:DNA end-binding protein Ku
MPASIFNGAISFGLVSVPITVLSAIEDHSGHFRRIHTEDGGLVRNRYWCEAEAHEVTYGEIGRGYELPDGRAIPVTDEELRQMPLPTARDRTAGFHPGRRCRPAARRRRLPPPAERPGGREAVRAAVPGSGARVEGRGRPVRVARP